MSISINQKLPANFYTVIFCRVVCVSDTAEKAEVISNRYLKRHLIARTCISTQILNEGDVVVWWSSRGEDFYNCCKQWIGAL